MDAFKDSSCSESLLQLLETDDDFQPLSSIKRMKPGEGLTKIWMCPSSELATVLFSPKPVARGQSTNLLESIAHERRYSSSESSSSYDEDEYSSSESSSTFVASESETLPGEEKSHVSEESEDDRLVVLQVKLKDMYKGQLAAGVESLRSNSLKRLENELYKLVVQVRQQEKDKIDEELDHLVMFLNKYEWQVNQENIRKLKREYRSRRRSWIARMIDVAEERYRNRCTQIEKELKEKYYFRVKELKNKHYTAYRDTLKIEMNKWVKIFKSERDSIVESHEKAVASVKNKYNELFKEMQQREENKVRIELEKFERIMETEKTPTQILKEIAIKSCSENSAWMCVIRQLLSDMQNFINDHIKQDIDMKRMLAINRRQSMPPAQIERISEEKLNFLRSFDSLPCGRVVRDEELHRQLIDEANKIINEIIGEIAMARMRKVELQRHFRHLKAEEGIQGIQHGKSLALGEYVIDESSDVIDYSVFATSVESCHDNS